MTARPSREGGAVLVGTEVLLAAMTVAAVVGHARLFGDDTWRGPLIGAALTAHLVMVVMRRLGRGLVLTAAASLAVMAVQITVTHYRDTATVVLPSGLTRTALELDLRTAWELFDEVKAPTDSTVGFLVLSTLAIWVIAYLADWAAFRLSSALEALLPAFAMVVFIAYFGEPRNRLLLTSIYLLAVTWFLLLHRVWRDARQVRWLAGTERAGTTALLRTGAVVSAIAVLGAVAFGPVLPGAGEQALVDLDPDGGGPGTRVVISPIVDIRGRLVDQADIEVFTVRSPVPVYWRLASLDSFNGSIWGADNSYSSVSGPLPDDFPNDASVTSVEQSFSVTNLGAVWIPAAYEPRAVRDASDDSISYEPTSGTLIVGRDLASSDGLTYTVTSAVPTFDPAALAAAPDAYPPEILERYTQVPDDFSPDARSLAATITEGLDSDFERSIALQDWFHDNFVYDIDVGEGHSNARIDEFLASKRGYCEQFAGSFAAMARSIGMPARVVVGFTWGDRDPVDPDLWHVRGEHAHAWPEVYIPGSGWVSFEPTPGRGAPGAERWTGVDPAQVGTTPGEPAVPTPAAGPTVAPGTVPERPIDDPLGAPVDAAAPAPDGDGLPAPALWALRLVAVVAALVAVYTAIVVGAKTARRNRRRSGAVDNRDRVQTAWIEGVESMRPLGLEPDLTETAAEFARRAGAHTPPARDELSRLGSLSVVATFGADEPDESMVDAANGHRTALDELVRAHTTTRERIRDLLDPRPLLR